MAGLGDLRGKAEEFLKNNPDKVSEGIEKAGDFFDEKTGGKFADKVDGLQQGAKDFLGGLGGKSEGTEG